MRLLLAVVASLTTTLTGTFAAEQQNTAVTRDVTIVGTVTRIDRQSRSVTCALEGGGSQTVRADRELTTFDDLKVGDVVTVRYVESVVVAVRRGASMQTEKETTAAARRGAGGENIELQAKAVVTIDRIDLERSVVEYRTADGRRVVRRVEHKNLLEGLRAGDRIEVTFTLERAVSIDRRRR